MVFRRSLGSQWTSLLLILCHPCVSVNLCTSCYTLPDRIRPLQESREQAGLHCAPTPTDSYGRTHVCPSCTLGTDPGARPQTAKGAWTLLCPGRCHWWAAAAPEERSCWQGLQSQKKSHWRQSCTWTSQLPTAWGPRSLCLNRPRTPEALLAGRLS